MFLFKFKSIAYYHFTLFNINVLVLRQFVASYISTHTVIHLHTQNILTPFYTISYIISYKTQTQITKHTYLPQKSMNNHYIFYKLDVILIHITLILHKHLLFYTIIIIDSTRLDVSDIYNVLATIIILLKSFRYE